MTKKLTRLIGSGVLFHLGVYMVCSALNIAWTATLQTGLACVVVSSAVLFKIVAEAD